MNYISDQIGVIEKKRYQNSRQTYQRLACFLRKPSLDLFARFVTSPFNSLASIFYRDRTIAFQFENYRLICE